MVKNITISLDDATYRKVRIAAAQRDTSVSGLVKRLLLTTVVEEAPPRDLVAEQDALLDRIRSRHPGFTSTENLPRGELHERR